LQKRRKEKALASAGHGRGGVLAYLPLPPTIAEQENGTYDLKYYIGNSIQECCPSDSGNGHYSNEHNSKIYRFPPFVLPGGLYIVHKKNTESMKV
jgi:hypothetical protein